MSGPNYARRIPNREAKAAQCAKEYREGASIRELMERHGVSYGGMRALVVSGGAAMRPRGGDVRAGAESRRDTSDRMEGGR
ncbi:conserved hypothetical protein [Rhodococcus phage E3]|uniref:hypothetical protein n=1 Tax=Rhodococcus phage E3 TaxID=1007869 RepID=UPI0002C6A7B6|nr:hypothetical protein M176_gp175 [Rhodococcus phage E3]AEQ21083.1 conserved hypothetical protein [Rhodococcus phage E3]